VIIKKEKSRAIHWWFTGWLNVRCECELARRWVQSSRSRSFHHELYFDLKIQAKKRNMHG